MSTWFVQCPKIFLLIDYSQDIQTRSNSETSLVSSNLGSNQLDLFNDDTECLLPSGGNSPSRLKNPQIGIRRLSATNKVLGGSLFTLAQPSLEPGVFRSLNYPAFQSLRIERVSFWNHIHMGAEIYTKLIWNLKACISVYTYFYTYTRVRERAVMEREFCKNSFSVFFKMETLAFLVFWLGGFFYWSKSINIFVKTLQYLHLNSTPRKKIFSHSLRKW